MAKAKATSATQKKRKKSNPRRPVIRTGSLVRLNVSEDEQVRKLDPTKLPDFQQFLSRLCGRDVALACVSGREPGCGDCPGCVAAEQLPHLAAPWTLGKLNQALLLSRRGKMSPGFYRSFFPDEASNADLLEGLTQFRAYAMLRFGGFRPAFDRLAGLTEDEIRNELRDYCQSPAQLVAVYKSRTHGQDLIDPEEIEVQDRWLLGYISPRQLLFDFVKEEALSWRVNGERPAHSPASARYRSSDLDAARYHELVTDAYRKIRPAEVTRWRGHLGAKRRELEALSKRQAGVIRVAERNSAAYLAASHIDVYVATSMRESWEYDAMARAATDIFGDPILGELGLTMFDPTLSFYDSRYDKGLVEGLMLNRARVTIYMVQETDTLGKDSELAATLAYGRPVIAYVPRYSPGALVKEFRGSPLRRTFTRLQYLMAENLIEDDDAKAGLALKWRFKPSFELDPSEERAFRTAHAAQLKKLYRAVADAELRSLQRRADNIAKTHPLGLQLQQGTGVAVGVLVARTPARCARLLLQLLTNQMRLRIYEDPKARATSLIECDDGSSEATYRVVTMDPVLTNAFWTHWA